jgi:polyisoprenoid-binding protein YceI
VRVTAKQRHYRLRPVAIQAGTHALGPADGTLTLRTGRTGAVAKAGHDLLIDVTAWQATVEVGDDPAAIRVEITVDGASLCVREGTGGLQTLGDDDKADIRKTIDDEILKRQAIAFRSTGALPGVEGGVRVEGDLTLLGTTRPLAVDVTLADDGAITARAVITQTQWGIKPYSALFGALKVADDVRVELEARVPSG